MEDKLNTFNIKSEKLKFKKRPTKIYEQTMGVGENSDDRGLVSADNSKVTAKTEAPS